MSDVLEPVDLVISYLYPRLLKREVLSLGRLGAVNFHPAPLPDFKGFAPCTFGILENFPYWAVSAHYMTNKIDEGDLISVRKFEVDLGHETAYSLTMRSHTELLELFKEVMSRILSGESLSRTKQSGGRYFSRREFEEQRVILPYDSLETINRKARAYWYPPHEGAFFSPSSAT
jgi:methionyl-tRNA formyltransferase